MNLPAKKIEIIGLKEKYEEILEELQLIGAVQIISLDSERSVKEEKFYNKKQELELSLAQVKFAKNFLFAFAEKENFLKGLIDSFHPAKREYTIEEINNLASSPTIKEAVYECQDIEKRFNKITATKERLKREIEELEKFAGISIKNSEKLNNFDIFTGSISKDKKQSLIDALKEKSIFFFIEWGREREGARNVGFCMVYPKNDNSFCRIAEAEGAKKESVVWEEEPSQLITKKQNSLEGLKEEEEEKARKLAKKIPEFEALIDFYTWELEKMEVLQSGEETKNYFYLKAWLKADQLNRLKKRLKKITPYFRIEEITPEEDENTPVFVKNKGLMKSFEVVTKIYGFPKSSEPDPTPYLAPFFAISFGLALSDAGYGLLLIALSFIAKKKLQDADDFFNLFLLSGVFTIIAGLLTGTFFGTDLFQGLRVMDPMENPINILFLVSILGIIQIIAGLLVGFFWEMSQKRKDVAFGTKLGPLFFFLGLGVFFLTKSLPLLGLFILIMVGFSIYFSTDESIIKRLGGGFASLYGLIGYFSDVLSYSRLLALGLATGIIAMTINMIAQISMEMIPVAGLNIVVAGVILIFGHFANLAINALSSFIHSSRLQFVEFFSKFMEGGGEEIKPLRKQGRFIKVVNQ